MLPPHLAPSHKCYHLIVIRAVNADPEDANQPEFAAHGDGLVCMLTNHAAGKRICQTFLSNKLECRLHCPCSYSEPQLSQAMGG